MEPELETSTPQTAWAWVIAIVCGAEIIVVAAVGGAGVGALLEPRWAVVAAGSILVVLWLTRRSISSRSGRG